MNMTRTRRGRHDADQVIHSVYQAVDQPHLWSRALELIADAAHADHVLLGCLDDGQMPMLHSARVERTEVLHGYLPSLSESPFKHIIPTCPEGMLTFGYSLIEARVLVDSEFYDTRIHPIDGHFSLVGIPLRFAGGMAFIAACRSRRKGEFNADDLLSVQRTMPHLSTALGLRHRLVTAQRDSRHREQALNQLQMGVIVLDDRHRPLFVNTRAARMLATGRDLYVADGVLTARSAAANRKLHRHIDHAGRTAPSRGGGLVTLERNAGLTPLILRIKPIDDSDALLDDYAAARSVVYIDSLQSSPVDAEALRSCFGLTEREIDLCIALTRGEDLAECARGLGIEVSTVRAHLKSLFNKTGVRRQAELVSLLLRTLPNR